MADLEKSLSPRRLTTPRAAAVAGVLFALLFSASVILVRTSIPDDPAANMSWANRNADKITAAITLTPFAGIAFLWFVGVVRDRLGELEDRFFSSVVFGSALLFVAMLFVAMAIGGGIFASAKASDGNVAEPDAVRFGREVMLQISNVYGSRMAGVFMISLATVWSQTGVMPRWLALVTLVLALVLLFVISFSVWFLLIFPAWVFLVSAFILIGSFAQGRQIRPT
jgi:hypothetical protein